MNEPSKSAEVFALVDGQGRLLSPATQASVLAKYSRSPLSAKDLLATTTEEEARAFQEKWGVTYGHSSVAELAYIPFCFEGVSIIATKELEKWQRGAYSEKSTRYQQFSIDSFVRPEGLPDLLMLVVQQTYKIYHAITEILTPIIAEKIGKPKDSAVVKARVFDNARYCLPAGTGTNVACVWNTRDARYVMNDLLGSKNPEFRQLGVKMKAAAEAVAPVFGHGVKPNEFTFPIKNAMAWGDELGNNQEHVLMPGLCSHPDTHHVTQMFKNQVRYMYEMTWEEFCVKMNSRKGQQVPDIFKSVRIQFDVFMDYGAFRDLQRHRRCEQTVELLTPNYGFLTPDDICGLKIQKMYEEGMKEVIDIARTAITRSVDPEIVQYILPLGTIHRSRFDMDLKELYYLTELRTQPQGHISYRRIAWEMFQLAKSQHPELMQWCRAINPTAIGEHN